MDLSNLSAYCLKLHCYIQLDEAVRFACFGQRLQVYAGMSQDAGVSWPASEVEACGVRVRAGFIAAFDRS